jgi:di/tricarboxylate transporter
MSMITGPGGYRAPELLRIGIPLSLLYSFIVVLMVNLMF